MLGIIKVHEKFKVDNLFVCVCVGATDGGR